MADEKKKPEDEKTEPKLPEVEKDKEPPKEEKQEPPKDEEKPTDEKQTDENGEGAKSEDKPEDNAEPEQEETPPEAEPPKLSAEEELKSENLRLKTQLEAMKIGFNPNVIEDAVVLAENIVKRDGSDIATALQAVAKKYPDWKSDGKDSKKGGFKIGADSGSKSTSDEKLNEAFGIKKKG